MPELPEVETIKNQLKELIVSKKIKEVKIGLPKLVKLPLDKFRKIVAGSMVKDVNRRAKILVFEFSNDWSMLVHLKLSGRLIFREKGEPLQPEDTKWNHLIYYFNDGSRLFHNDLRQFGYVKLVKTDGLKNFFKKEKLGPEPLEKNFNLVDFKTILKEKPRFKAKQLLMDQQVIAGIGNIYSDEILFFAKVNPLRKIADLKLAEIKKIFEGIKKILPEAVKLKGSSVDIYLDASGKKGNYVPKIKVYGREGLPCFRCREKIKRIKLGGRSAHYCPTCQKL